MLERFEMKYNRHGSLLEKSFCFLYQKKKCKLEVSCVGVGGVGSVLFSLGSVAEPPESHVGHTCVSPSGK